MTTAFSSLIGLALPVEGELDGTWGDVVNNATTSYLDIAIAGTQTLSANADATLVQTFGTDLATNIGSTTAQYAIIRWTASNGGTTRNINVPNSSKTYVVINDGTGSIVLRGVTGPTTGITIVSGEKCVAAWNGSDFVKVSTSVADGVTSVGGTGTVNGITLTGTVTSTGNLTLGGALTGVNLATQVTGTLPIANGGTGSTSTTFVNLASNVTGTLPVANGGTGLATTTAYSVVFSGTTATGNFQATAGPGTATHVLTSNGAGALPTFQAASGITTGKSIAMAMIFGF
jgi:hypothetical protein